MGEPLGPLPAGASLASRLRELRRSGFTGIRLTQLQLANALSEDEPVADSTLSSWENVRSPTLLPPHQPAQRLRAVLRYRALTAGDTPPRAARGADPG